MLVKEQFDYNKTRWFFFDPDNIKLYNAMMRCVKGLAKERDRTDLYPILLEVNSVEDFEKMKWRDREFVIGVVKVIEEDRDGYWKFFKERGDV